MPVPKQASTSSRLDQLEQLVANLQASLQERPADPEPFKEVQERLDWAENKITSIQSVVPEHRKQTEQSSGPRKLLRTLDSWGHDEDVERPKHWSGGLICILLCCGLLAYSIILWHRVYRNMHPIATNNVIWSISDGPYDIPIKCFSQKCLVSVNVNQNSDCAKRLPPSGCHELGPGEERVFQTCYSLLVNQGVHVRFTGPHQWSLDTGLEAALGVEAPLYGAATNSDMLGMTPNMPVMPFLTPIKAGFHLMDFVKTHNKTRPSGTDGRLRREWFSQFLYEVNETTVNQIADPCTAVVANGSGLGQWHRSILGMAPQWTEIIVEPVPNWVMSAVGELGGAMDIGTLLAALILAMGWQMSKCIRFGKALTDDSAMLSTAHADKTEVSWKTEV